MKILGIETSCDDTAVAVVEDGKEVLSSIVSSQVEAHAEHGGIVPELGARKHIENISFVYNKALEEAGINDSEIDAIAVTTSPGLRPALNIGISFAKGLAKNLQKPLIEVDHLMGHVYSLFLKQEGLDEPKFPMVVLIVSGGHTQLLYFENKKKHKLVGETVDDAAGESFDKVARMLNLGYPGGPIIDKLARKGDASAIDFPRPMIDSGDFNFSFSGLKTSVLYHIRDNELEPTKEKTDNYKQELNRFATYDIAASFQEAVVDTLVTKTIACALKNEAQSIGIVGGVSANSRLRNLMGRKIDEYDMGLYYPNLEYTMDNAAMIAARGFAKCGT